MSGYSYMDIIEIVCSTAVIPLIFLIAVFHAQEIIRKTKQRKQHKENKDTL